MRTLDIGKILPEVTFPAIIRERIDAVLTEYGNSCRVQESFDLWHRQEKILMKHKCVIVLKTLLTFYIGFCIGYLISFTIHSYTHTNGWVWLTTLDNLNKASKVYRKLNLKIEEPIGIPTKLIDDRKPISLLCYLLIGPSTHSSAIHVKDTWGKRCDKIIFYSTQQDDSLNTVPLKVKEGYSYLWEKSKHALKHLYENHYHDFDWFLKADDDTYIIVENLKSFLNNHSSSDDPVYFGVKFKMFVEQGFMSGGGGYVFSKEALRRVVTEGLNNNDTNSCPHNKSTGSEDVNLGKCFESVGVSAEESFDDEGKPRFFSHGPEALFYRTELINRLHWYWKYINHPHSLGPECCSKNLISFHGITPRMMWVLEMLLYHIQVKDLQSNVTDS